MIFRKPEPKPAEPEPQKWLCYADLVAHFGNSSKTREALCRARILNERPTIPWDWDEVLDSFYQSHDGLIWSNERIIVELRKTQAKLDELRFRA